MNRGGLVLACAREGKIRNNTANTEGEFWIRTQDPLSTTIRETTVVCYWHVRKTNICNNSGQDNR